MKVDSLVSGVAVPAYAPKDRYPHKDEREPAAPSAPQERAAASHATASPARPEAGRHGGVLRLLQDGHFNGVAGLRLRAHFREELQAQQKKQASSELRSRVDAIPEEVSTLADTHLPAEYQAVAAGEAFAGALASLETAASDAIADHVDTAPPDPYAFRQTVRAAFDTFQAAVHDLLVPAGSELMDEASDSAGELPAYPPEIPSKLAVFMSELASTFTDAIREMSHLVSSDESLTPSGEPPGQGAAYEKFMAEYNRLRLDPAPTAAERVDIHV